MSARLLMIAFLAALGLSAAAPAHSAAAGDGEPARMRRWHVGVMSTASWRGRFDVFDREGLPPGPVEATGRGGGLVVGRRFGDRFLAQLLVAYAVHDVEGSAARLGDAEALLTGTVLFGPTRTLQPFLRGGIGGGGQAFEPAAGGGAVFAFGPAAIAGGGMLVRAGDRVSLELEAVATVTDFLQVEDGTDDEAFGGDDWQVRSSHWGWRAGVGVQFWF